MQQAPLPAFAATARTGRATKNPQKFDHQDLPPGRKRRRTLAEMAADAAAAGSSMLSQQRYGQQHDDGDAGSGSSIDTDMDMDRCGQQGPPWRTAL